jgi:hypothetical protein
LTKTAFSLRFQQLQAELNASLLPNGRSTIEVLASQDRLILRVEGWVDSLADLHISDAADIDLFRQTLATNRQFYRLKTLAIRNVAISEMEKADLASALHDIIWQISARTTDATTQKRQTVMH